MRHRTFPEFLYIHEPLSEKDPFDGYRTWEDAEADDTLAVYELKRVVRVKEIKTKHLEEE